MSTYFNEEERISSNKRFNDLNRHVKAIVATSDLIRMNKNKNIIPTLKISVIQQIFGGRSNVAIKTNHRCILEEITTCWAKAKVIVESNSNGQQDIEERVGKQIPCPINLLKSARNSASKFGCSSVVLDRLNEDTNDNSKGIDNSSKCTLVSNAFLKELQKR